MASGTSEKVLTADNLNPLDVISDNDDQETQKLKLAIFDVFTHFMKPIHDKLNEALQVSNSAKVKIEALETQNEILALHMLEKGVYERKKNLILSGVKGPKNESQEETMEKVTEILQAIDSDTDDYSIVHRLAPKEDSPIIIALNNLSDTNAIMENAKMLKDYNNKNRTTVSIQIQTHPAIKELRSELLNIRKTMEPEEKRKSYVKHYPTYPFFGLTRKGKATIFTKKTKNEVVKMFIKYLTNDKADDQRRSKAKNR